MSERYIGCMMCGIRRSLAKHQACADENILSLATERAADSHLWTEMVSVPGEFYGEGLLGTLKPMKRETSVAYVLYGVGLHGCVKDIEDFRKELDKFLRDRLQPDFDSDVDVYVNEHTPQY